MSDVQDDLDDDLPSVSLSQTTGEKSELEMPPASEVASLRAREEAAERALQDLRDSYNVPRVLNLCRSSSQGSSSSEGGEAALSAAVSALQVTDPPPGVQYAREARLLLLTAMREHLDDKRFLDAYIQVLKDKPETVDMVTEKLLTSISSALINGYSCGITGVSSWLICVSLTTTRALRARRALHAVLDMYATSQDLDVLVKATVAALKDDVEQLLSAYDAIRSGAARGSDTLANALLSHAMAAALPTDEQEMKPLEPPPPLSSSSIDIIRTSWRRMPARAQLLLLRCVGRALAAAGTGQEVERQGREMQGEGIGQEIWGQEIQEQEIQRQSQQENRGHCGAGAGAGAGAGDAGPKSGGSALLAALAQPLPRASAHHLDRQQVLTNLSKLQLLFRSRFGPETENEPEENLDYSAYDLTGTPTKYEPIIDIKTGDPMDISLTVETPTKEKEKVVKKGSTKTQTTLDKFITTPVKIKTHLEDKYKRDLEAEVEVKLKGDLEKKIKELEDQVKKEEGERSPERKKLRRELRERRGVKKLY